MPPYCLMLADMKVRQQVAWLTHQGILD